MAPSSNSKTWTVMLSVRTDSGELVTEATSVQVDQGVEAAAEAILDRFDKKLGSARQVKVIPVGAFALVEFHRLWMARGNDHPLIVYSLGLGTSTQSAALPERSAAVVAGSYDLAAVTREATAVGEHLRKHGWVVSDRWSLDDREQPRLLHYAGHGNGGDGLGWNSAIDVPEIGRISAAQIVAGQRSPDLVVLGACSAGRISSDSIDGGMNIAAAFLLAGAQLVVAPTRDVDDEAAHELGVGLYRDLEAADAEVLVRALAQEQREQLSRGEVLTQSTSFSAWRAWTP